MSATSHPIGASPDPKLDAFLVSKGLARADETARWSALAGGVSSDIWRADLPGRSLCVKRALAKLKVWTVPPLARAMALMFSPPEGRLIAAAVPTL